MNAVPHDLGSKQIWQNRLVAIVHFTDTSSDICCFRCAMSPLTHAYTAFHAAHSLRPQNYAFTLSVSVSAPMSVPCQHWPLGQQAGRRPAGLS